MPNHPSPVPAGHPRRRVTTRSVVATAGVLLLGLTACSSTASNAGPGSSRSAAPARSAPEKTASATPSAPHSPSTSPSSSPSRSRSSSPSSPKSSPSRTTANSARKKGKVVYYTFDDGPETGSTQQILDILQRYDAVATFFTIGRQVAEFPDIVKAEHDAGMSVQNHTWSHPALSRLSAGEVRSQVSRTDAAIEQAIGVTPTCVRPPYGATDSGVRRVLRQEGKQQVMWDVDPQDWARPGTATIVRRVLSTVHDGAIVLDHDGGGDRSQTVAALPTILKTLKARGYSFGLLCQD